jgi:hypothetical protein
MRHIETLLAVGTVGVRALKGVGCSMTSFCEFGIGNNERNRSGGTIIGFEGLDN